MQIPLVDIIAGARPNFMKVSPIIRALEARNASKPRIAYRFIHTGQHYDQSMSGEFLSQLELPEPDLRFNVGSGTQAQQTGSIMIAYETALQNAKPNLCLVVGDVNSSLACAISAQKSGVPVAHVEGGLRSGDWSMPEEINRLATDAISNWFFTTSQDANSNLTRSGVEQRRIFFVGNTMIDTLRQQLPYIKAPEFFAAQKLEAGSFLLVTLHRPSNVDNATQLEKILRSIEQGAAGFPVVFPIHPRTQKVFEQLKGTFRTLIVVGPQAYRQFIYLVTKARGVVTDSGGVTEETTALGVPCATIRNSTERPETITMGTNVLTGEDPVAIKKAVSDIMSQRWKRGALPPFWDGRASERIVGHLEKLLF